MVHEVFTEFCGIKNIDGYESAVLNLKKLQISDSCECCCWCRSEICVASVLNGGLELKSNLHIQNIGGAVTEQENHTYLPNRKVRIV